MTKLYEQISPHEPNRGYRKRVKKQTVRRRRHEEKISPETAPTKERYRGHTR